MTTVAAFDFDGTLTTRDCVVPFLERMVGRAGLVARVLAHPVQLTAGAIRRDRDRIKAVAVRAAFAGRLEATVEDVGHSFAQTIRAGWLRADTPLRLAWHQAQGHRVVIVSASFGAYLRPLGEMLGLDGVLCTEAAVGPDGRYTGELVGSNCRGAEKLVRLQTWMRERTLSDAELWAYGDSRGDRELLAAAQHPLYVKDVVVTADPDEQR